MKEKWKNPLKIEGNPLTWGKFSLKAILASLQEIMTSRKTLQKCLIESIRKIREGTFYDR